MIKMWELNHPREAPDKMVDEICKDFLNECEWDIKTYEVIVEVRKYKHLGTIVQVKEVDTGTLYWLRPDQLAFDGAGAVDIYLWIFKKCLSDNTYKQSEARFHLRNTAAKKEKVTKVTKNDTILLDPVDILTGQGQDFMKLRMEGLSTDIECCPIDKLS